jgi:hypothetical protein
MNERARGSATTIHRLTVGNVPAPLAGALDAFEKQFHYPLGAGRSFSISHGPDYPLFYSSVSAESFVLAAERNGVVLGTLGAAVKPMKWPDGQIRPSAYLGDLKLAPSARMGRVFWRLTTAAREALTTPCENRAYGVVMDGTSRIPSTYTGRWGVERFRMMGRVIVLRIPVTVLAASPVVRDPPRFAQTSIDRVEERFLSDAPGAFIPIGGLPRIRSRITPIGLSLTDEAASGVLEDTRRGKRLLDERSTEMMSAHLSAFRWRDAEAGVRLIHEGLAESGRLGFSHLFTAIPKQSLRAFRTALANVGWRDVTEAPASIYGCGFTANESSDWRVNTSEI